MKELDLEDVHIALQESRMLSQEGSESRSENHVYSTTIKTKRGLIKPRGEIKFSIYIIFLRTILVLELDPLAQGKPF